MTSNERRNALLEILSMRRFETLENLAFEFGVSKRTIRYDIEILSLTYPIYTVQGNGGGIHVDENYRLGKSYLKRISKSCWKDFCRILTEKTQRL